MSPRDESNRDNNNTDNNSLKFVFLVVIVDVVAGIIRNHLSSTTHSSRRRCRGRAPDNSEVVVCFGYISPNVMAAVVVSLVDIMTLITIEPFY